MSILREIKSFIGFYFYLRKSQRDIVFYAEDAASYSYFESLIEYLTSNMNLPVCYVTSDPKDPIFKTANSNIHPFFIKELLPLFTVTLNSKLLLMTMPDLQQFHIKRSIRGTRHIYIFHNIGSSFPVIRHGALFHYDVIFCVGPHHKEEIRIQENLYNLKEKELFEFGYPRLEKAYLEYQNFDHSLIQKNEDTKGTILLGPTWGENSILNFCGEELINILLDGGYKVIVRPHPMTFIHDSDLITHLENIFLGNKHFQLERSTLTLSTMYESDILICDWSGFSYEFAFGTERPVLFIDVPQKVVNPRFKELNIEPIDVLIREELGALVSPDKLDELLSVIPSLLGSTAKFKDKIKAARNKYIYHFQSSGKAGALAVKSLLNDANKC